jgi:hypothetical protein
MADIFLVGKITPADFCSTCIPTYIIVCDLPRAALAAALATLGSTTDAKKATVDITGLPCWLNGTGRYANGPTRHVTV